VPGEHARPSTALEHGDVATVVAGVTTSGRAPICSSPCVPAGRGATAAPVQDVRTDEILDPPWQRAARDAVLILDGLFLHRDQLAELWDVSVFLQVPFSVTLIRMAIRDRSRPHPGTRAWPAVSGTSRYLAACMPWRRADLVIDNADWARPFASGVQLKEAITRHRRARDRQCRWRTICGPRRRCTGFE
jgi:hypothetical protein